MPEIKNGKDLAFFVTRIMQTKQYELAQKMLDSVKEELNNEPGVSVVGSDATTHGGIMVISAPEDSRDRVVEKLEDKIDKWRIKFGKAGTSTANIQKAMREV